MRSVAQTRIVAAQPLTGTGQGLAYSVRIGPVTSSALKNAARSRQSPPTAQSVDARQAASSTQFARKMLFAPLQKSSGKTSLMTVAAFPTEPETEFDPVAESPMLDAKVPSPVLIPVAVGDDDDDDSDSDDDSADDDKDDADDGFKDDLDEDDDVDEFGDIDEDDFDDNFDDDFEEELEDDYEIEIDDEISAEFGLNTGDGSTDEEEDELDDDIDDDLDDFEDFDNVD